MADVIDGTPVTPVPPAGVTPAKPAGEAAPAKAAKPVAAAKPAAAPKQAAAKPAAEQKQPAKAAAAKPAVPALGEAPSEDAADDELPQLGDTPAEEDAASDVDADAGDAAEAEAEAEADDDGEAPEVEYDFSAPEGEPAYRTAIVDAYTEAARKHNLSPEVAKDLLDTMISVARKDNEAQFTELVEQQTNANKAKLVEQHGKGLRRVMDTANRALLQGAPQEFIDRIRGRALATDPGFVSLLAFYGQRTTNDRPPRKAEGSPPQKPLSPEAEAAAEYERNQKRGY
jgi:hypothetical protein